MSGPAILVLDNDPNSLQFIQAFLSNAGYRVAAVNTPLEFIDMLERYRFEVVLVEAWLENVDRQELFQIIKDQQPEAQVVYLSSKKMFSWAVESFRQGARDFLIKPIDQDALLQAVERAMEPPPTAAAPAPAAPTFSAPPMSPAPGLIEDPNLMDDILGYHEEILKIFLSLERQNAYLEEQVNSHSSKSKAIAEGLLDLMIVHHDDGIFQTLERFTKDRRLRLSQVYTGGEVLDLIGQRRYDVLVISRGLPDIDGEMLSMSLKSQYPTIEIILVSEWGSQNTRAEILANQDQSSVQFRLRSGRDIHSLFDEIRGRRKALAEETEFAKAFKERHEKFLKRFAEMKVRIDRAITG